MAFDPSPLRREPIINAPLVVTATAGALVVLHPIEEIGEKLRGMMQWSKSNRLVNRDRN